MSKKYKKIIIIEDDCIPFRNFLKFFDISFKIMEKDNQIEAICAYQHPNISNKFNEFVNLKMNLFIPWGWGTLSSNWNKFQNYKSKIDLPKIYDDFKKKKNKKTIWSLNYISYMYQKEKNVFILHILWLKILDLMAQVLIRKTLIILEFLKIE